MKNKRGRLESTLYFPPIIVCQNLAGIATGTLPAHFPENIILKALTYKYTSPTFETDWTSWTVMVKWAWLWDATLNLSIMLKHWRCRARWDFNIMKKTAPQCGLSHLAPMFVAHNARPQGVKCSEWPSPLDLMHVSHCCQNDLAVTWWEVLNVAWAYSQQMVSGVARQRRLPGMRHAVERQDMIIYHFHMHMAIQKQQKHTPHTYKHDLPLLSLFVYLHPLHLSISCLTCSHMHRLRSIKLHAWVHFHHPTSWLMAPSAAPLNDCAHFHSKIWNMRTKLALRGIRWRLIREGAFSPL